MPDRMPPTDGDGARGAFPLPEVVPDIVVIVVAPDEHVGRVRRRIHDLLDAGVREAWVVDPAASLVTVVRWPSDVRILRPGDRLEGVLALPGLSVPVEVILGIGSTPST